MLDVLHDDRFIDKAPATVFAQLLDEGIYLCSPRTMYRILHENKEVRERRDQLRHPEYKKPELLAEGPNQVWSWDITKLRGPEKWKHYYLYVVMDIYSRYVVGWMIATRGNAELATMLIEETCMREHVDENELIIHSDRGPEMTSKVVAQLLADLGVTKSHSRPHTSNDNPYSEAQFKTLKYHSTFPKQFGSIEDARSYCREFFNWYNEEHVHSSIGLMTPAAVHSGAAVVLREKRQRVLAHAYSEHPERFENGCPDAPVLPKCAWINPPKATRDAFVAATGAGAVVLNV